MLSHGESSLLSGREVLVSLTENNALRLSCVFLGTEHGKMHLRTEQWIEPLSRVNAEIAQITIPGQVVDCVQEGTGYRVCISMNSSDAGKRREPRFPVRKPGKVVILGEKSAESSEGVMLDASVSGIRIEMAHRVDIGTMIFFVTDSTVLAGEVRYCHQRRSRHFEAGIEISIFWPI